MAMVTRFGDPFGTLRELQRALESRTASDWLRGSTAASGTFPPINIFQQGDNFVAIVELPGIDRNQLKVEAKENRIRISGEKQISYKDGVSLHRRERVSGVFDRTLSVPVRIDADKVRAEYHDGILALFISRAESDKPRAIAIS
jgi:HSP20 family protein